MIEQINKGDILLCQETFIRGDQQLYKQGEVYTSNEDHFLTDENGNDQGGWNNEILNQHFKKNSISNKMNKVIAVPAAALSKLDQLKLQYPDAKEYYKKNQSYVKADIARIETYGADIAAKLLFDRDIPSTTGVTQQFIFSVEALQNS